MYEKTGFSRGSTANNRGFGYIHDGSVESLFEFLQFGGFNFSNDQQRRDVAAFLMAFSTQTHAGVGAQVTLPQPADAGPGPAVDALITIAETGQTGLVVKGLVDGEPRGYYLAGPDAFQSDREAEILDETTMLALAGPGAELTFTLVPSGSAVRIGVDRDLDGVFDQDEIDAGSDPADPSSLPLPGDLNGDGHVDTVDFLMLLSVWGPCPPSGGCPADLDGDGDVDTTDFLILLSLWG